MTGTVQAVRRSGFTAQDRERVLDLWSAVTEAGGAVGFVPGAARADIETALRAHEDSMRAGYTVAVLVRIDASNRSAMSCSHMDAGCTGSWSTLPASDPD